MDGQSSRMLRNTLDSMGMHHAFAGRADFSGMTRGQLVISEVVQSVRQSQRRRHGGCCRWWQPGALMGFDGGAKIPMIEQWLQKRTTVAEVEATYGWGTRQNARWEELKARMMDDDELWEYCSPRETWNALAGRQGIALVRNGNVVFAIVTIMS